GRLDVVPTGSRSQRPRESYAQRSERATHRAQRLQRRLARRARAAAEILRAEVVRACDALSRIATVLCDRYRNRVGQPRQGSWGPLRGCRLSRLFRWQARPIRRYAFATRLDFVTLFGKK